MQELKCKNCGAKLKFSADAEVVSCEKCGAKYTVTKTQKQPVKKQTAKPAVKTENKLNKKKRIPKPLVALIILVSLVGIIVSSLFVINAYAPANPKCYHKFVKSTFNGSYDGKDTPNSFYQVEIGKEISTNEVLYSFIDAKISATNARNISEIWINLSDVYEDELTITLSKGYANKTYLIKEKTLTAKDIKKDEDGWFLLYNNQKDGLDYSNDSKFYGELKIGFSANVKVREIVLLDTKKDFASMKVTKCTVGPKPTADGVDGYQEINQGNSTNAFDEQTKFPFKKADEE